MLINWLTSANLVADKMKRVLLTALLALFTATAFCQTNTEKFKDFAVTYEGKTQKLSDFVGKGKYVLVDFWASWCPPCRAEIPNLVNVHNKYKSDKFTVLGVALNDKPENSKKIMKDLGITYPQILNAGNDVAYLYNIKGIPEIMLFGPDGTILARGLRGANIEKAVKQALEQHKNGK